MLFNNLNLIYIPFISFITTFLSIPYVKKLGYLFNIIEQPKDRGQSKVAMIRSGGVAMIISYIVVITSLNFLNSFINIDYLDNLAKIFFISFSFFSLGLLDDLFQLSPWIKLILQIILACVITSFGMYSNSIIMPDVFGAIDISLQNSFAMFINILFIVGTINAINWLDGLDGLAGGYCGIISIGFFFLGIFSNNITVAAMALINLGCCIGFLRYNFYPAQIFMGDCGSYFLGANLSLMSIDLYSSDTSFINLISIIILLFYPLFDMVRVILKRIMIKKLPFFPDREHLHHLIIDRGHSDKKTVIILYLLTILSVTLSISFFKNFYIFLSIFCLFSILIIKKYKIIN